MTLHTLDQHRSSPTRSGRVTLVGAGPGDPGLLTLHAYQALQSAQVVLYDALVSQPILDLIPATVERIAVGKRCGQHSLPQAEIERVMLAKAAAGAEVVRLKGGDPLMFGRGGEEMRALRQAGIPYRVVPGVTAASACASYGAMPLTQRGVAQGVTFVTGHGKDGEPIADWSPYAIPGHTLVIYMGLKRAGIIQQGLLAAGLAADTPVAIVGQASQPGQQRVNGTLGTLTALADTPNLPTPAAILVGEVTALAEELDWFEPEAFQAPAASKSLNINLDSAAM
ncbi:uroporphyrinogen-III C-methyltransferase [Ferrimonas balearica]|uniref:uroporphyrinogen-III C-methyltransferase n=1 Tax=Ferrimonas balearica TaxID=44012 RepID=UPI001C9A07E5|nr:uroporphyrinogen-III C-methyltransferase [Ferrimonas balearica]MBY5993637.1 uroporphyrinogen-III C-methyltransferase [Ferrimonas balearica]